MLVAHDPGHGREGSVTGTMSLGVPERDWVLQMAIDLSASVPWAQHTLLRSSTEGVQYQQRAEVAHAAGADLVLCHHVNAFKTESADGLLAFVTPGDHISREVGEAIMRASPKELLRSKPKPVPASAVDWTRNAWSVMRHYHALGIPVVLIEWGFGTNPGDRAILLSDASRPALCVAGAAGIARAIELTHPKAMVS